MAFDIQNKLVVGITTTALFDLTYEHQIFSENGEDAFVQHQVANRNVMPETGSAFPFIKRLLNLNLLMPEINPVEVIILSRNDPKAGLRIMDALRHYELPISRSFFLSGGDPYKYMEAVNASLYLSTNKEEVDSAVSEGKPAGYILPFARKDDEEVDDQLRIAFDFDGVIVDDEAEAVYGKGGLPLFHHHEVEHRLRPLKDGPLMPLLKQISAIQTSAAKSQYRRNDGQGPVSISIVTARNAPSHERMMNTLEHHGIKIDQLFLTGGIEKSRILEQLKPQIFFDDQMAHLENAAADTPCVHIPFGVKNQTILSSNDTVNNNDAPFDKGQVDLKQIKKRAVKGPRPSKTS